MLLYSAFDGRVAGALQASCGLGRASCRTICTSTTIDSFVISLNRNAPEPISVSIWLAFGKPDTTVYLPLYYGVDALPANTGLGTCTQDYESFYRQHFEDAEFQAAKGSLLNTQVLELQKIAEANYGSMIITLRKELFPLEKAFVAGRPGFESDFAALYAKDKAAARKKLDAYVADAFAKVAELYARMGSDRML